MVKNLPANAGDIGDMGLIPGLERSPEIGMATHSSILVWKIPCSLEGYGPWACKELDMTEYACWRKHLYVFIENFYFCFNCSRIKKNGTMCESCYGIMHSLVWYLLFSLNTVLLKCTYMKPSFGRLCKISLLCSPVDRHQ